MRVKRPYLLAKILYIDPIKILKKFKNKAIKKLYDVAMQYLKLILLIPQVIRLKISLINF